MKHCCFDDTHHSSEAIITPRYIRHLDTNIPKQFSMHLLARLNLNIGAKISLIDRISGLECIL